MNDHEDDPLAVTDGVVSMFFVVCLIIGAVLMAIKHFYI